MYYPKDVFDKPEDYIDFFTLPDFEGQYFERKEIPTEEKKVNQSIKNVNDGLIETISAFANYNQIGGLIAIGINDKTNEVTGLDHLDDTQFKNLLTFNNLRNYSIQPKSFYIDNKLVQLLYVPYVENILCETADNQQKAWKRMGKRNVILSDTDKQQILRDKRLGSWENIILDAEYHEKDVDEKVAESFKRGYLEDAEYEVSMTEVLQQIGAIREQKGVKYWTNAGILFFDKSPQRMIAQAAVRFVRYDYLLKDNPHLSLTSYDKTFSYASLPALLQKVREFAKSPFFRQFTVRNADGHLQHFDQFPADALEEGIVNAMVHRDYALTTTIWCKLYLDAFVVENAGRLLQPDQQVPESFNLGNYKLVPNPRNPRLVEWTKKLRNPDGKPFVKGIAEGTRKMKDLMEKMYFPYPSYKTNGVTSMTLQSVSSPDELEALLREYKWHNQINMNILHAQSIEEVEAELNKVRSKTQQDKEKLQLTYNVALQKSPTFEKAKAYYEEMLKSNIPLDEISYNTLINKSQTFEQAKFFFEEMKSANLRPNEISYSTLINKSQTFEQAKFFFEEMKSANLRPNEISYNTLINKSQTFEQAEFFFEEMKSANLRPDEISYSTLINKSQTFEQAKFFFEEMKSANLRPNEISYNTLINKSQTFEQQQPYYQEFLQKFPFQKNNSKSEKNYNYLFFALFKKVSNNTDWEFVKAEILRLGVSLDEKSKSFYDDLRKKFG